MYLAFRRSERGNAPNYTAPPAVEASCPLYSGHIEQREGGSGDEVIASAAAFLQSLLAEQPRSPAELRTDRMLPPSDFKAKDDIPHARLSPGARHHNRHFDYLLCHIIFNRRQSCQRNKQRWTSSQRQIYRDWLLLYMEVQKVILSCRENKDSCVRWKIILLANKKFAEIWVYQE